MGHAEGVGHLGVGFASVEFEQAQGAFVPAGFWSPWVVINAVNVSRSSGVSWTCCLVMRASQ